MYNLIGNFFALVLYCLNQFGWHREAYCPVCLPPFHLCEGIKRTGASEELKDMMYGVASKDRIELDWFHEEHDPDGRYKVDCRINGMRMPLFVYALSTDRKVNQATIALYEFKAWKIPDFRSVGIIRDRTKTSRKSIDYFRTVADDCYPLEESCGKIRQVLALAL